MNCLLSCVKCYKSIFCIFQRSTDFKVKFDESLMHSYEDMVEVLQTKKAQIMDARAPHESSVVDRKIYLSVFTSCWFVIPWCIFIFNSFPASGDFCHLLITFANSLDPD